MRDSDVDINIAKNPNKQIEDNPSGTTLKIISIKPASEAVDFCKDIAITAMLKIMRESKVYRITGSMAALITFHVP